MLVKYFFLIPLFFFSVMAFTQESERKNQINYSHYAVNDVPRIAKRVTVAVFYELSSFDDDILAIILTNSTQQTKSQIVVEDNQYVHIADYKLDLESEDKILKLTVYVFPKTVNILHMPNFVIGGQSLVLPTFFVQGHGLVDIDSFYTIANRNDLGFLFGFALLLFFSLILIVGISRALYSSNTLFAQFFWLLKNSINFFSCNLLLFEVGRKMSKITKKNDGLNEQSELSLYHYIKLHSILIKRLTFIFGKEIKAFTAQELFDLLKENNFVQRNLESNLAEFFKTYNIVMYGSDFIDLDHRNQDTQSISQIIYNTRAVSKATVLKEYIRKVV